MAHISASRLAGATQRVELLIDQKISGVALSAGDTVDIPKGEAVYLKNIERVKFVEAVAPKTATR